MDDGFREWSCAETARAVARGEVSALELTDAALEVIEARDDEIGAFLELWPERARARARAIDAAAEARQAPLAGVPVALKDNLCVEGLRTTAGSRILEPFTAPYTATAVARLEAYGAVPVGKTNLDEFAMGSSTENSAFQETRNPWDPGRVPGGSSGGSAAAVAAGMVPGALGSDTGGSIRQPAALCGVVGLKPTWGRVSRYGLVAFASSLDQIGPLSRTVEDAALMFQAIAGADAADATTADDPVRALADRLDADPRGMTLGLPAGWADATDGDGGDQGLDPGVRARVEATLEELEEAGVEIRSVELPHQRHAVATYYVIATAEASSNLARYDGVRYGHRAAGGGSLEDGSLEEMFARSRSEGFGPEVERRILLGTFVLSAGYHDAYYGRAQRVRTLIRRDFESAFEEVDAVVGPTSPTAAFPLGERTEDPLAMYLSDVYTVPASLAGLPAISVPCGRDDDGLPVGLQLVGRAFGEARLLQVARLVEELRGPFPPAPTR